MRSMSYILFGKPSCFADCIDYARGHRLVSVEVKLKAYDVVHENIPMRELSGFWIWNFEDTVVSYEEPYGGILSTEGEERQQLSLRNANRRLRRRLNDFAEFEIPVTGDDAVFEWGKTPPEPTGGPEKPATP